MVKKTYSINVEGKIMDKITSRAKKENRSRSNMVELILENYYKEVLKNE